VTFIPFTIIVAAIVIFSGVYFYRKNKNQDESMMDEIREKKNRKSRLI